MPRGPEEAFHYHDTIEQVFYLLEGEAIFYLGDEEYRLKEGDSIYIKKNAVHKIANQSFATTRF